MIEDRRRVGSRLSVLRYLITVRVLGARGQLLGAAGGRSTPSSRRWPRTTTSGRCRCARRAAWCSTATAGCWSRTATPTASRSSASTPRDLNRTVRLLADGARRRRGRRPRDRRSPPPRADATGRSPSCRTPRWRRSRRSRRGASTSSCRTSSSSRCRRGGIPTRWPRTCSATSARSTTRRSPRTTALKSGDIVGQSGIEKVYNALLMGEDGAKRVVVNSVGREIRTLEEDAADRRQAPAADRSTPTCRRRSRTAFKASGFNGAAVVLDPNNGEVLGFTSRAGLRPERVRRRHRPRDLGGAQHRRAPAAATTARSRGATRPGRPSRWRSRPRRSRKASSRRTSSVHCARRRELLRPHASSAGRRAATARIDLRHAIEQSCNVYFYTVGNMTGDRQDPQVGDAARPRREERHRPAERSAGAGAVDRSGSASGCSEKWYAGETISVSIGQGAGVGDAGVDGGLHGDAGQRRHARHAAPAQGGRRRDRLEAGAAAAAAVDGRRSNPDKLQAIRDGLWMVVNGGGTGGRARIAGRDVSGKTGTAQVISNQGAPRPARPTRDLRDNGWFVFFAPRDNPQIAGVVFARARHARRRTRRRSRITCSRPFSPSRTAGRCRRRSADCRPAAAADPMSATIRRAITGAGRRRTGQLDVFERRLYYHIDWALLLAILALCALGVAMIYSTTRRSDPRRRRSCTSRSSTPSCSAWARWWSC